MHDAKQLGASLDCSCLPLSEQVVTDTLLLDIQQEAGLKTTNKPTIENDRRWQQHRLIVCLHHLPALAAPSTAITATELLTEVAHFNA